MMMTALLTTKSSTVQKLKVCGSDLTDIITKNLWTDEPIKALGAYFTYDQNLLKEKNFIERQDPIKNYLVINYLWSATRAFRYTVM